MTTELSIILEQVRQMQTKGDYCRAGALWAAHIETLLAADGRRSMKPTPAMGPASPCSVVPMATVGSAIQRLIR